MRRLAWCTCILFVTLSSAAERTALRRNVELAATVAVPSSSSPPRHPATVAQVRDIMKLTATGDLKQQMLDGLLPHVQEMLPYMPQDVIADIRQSITMADFESAEIRAWQTHLSTEEAAHIIAFLRTPAGRTMVGMFPQIESEGQQAGAALGQQIMLDVMQRHQVEIEAAREKYQREHSITSPAH